MSPISTVGGSGQNLQAAGGPTGVANRCRPSRTQGVAGSYDDR